MKGLVIGQGELGWRTLQVLTHAGVFDHITAVDVNPAQAGRTVVVGHGAELLNLRTRVDFRQLDALNLEQVTDLLDSLRPEAIVNTASLQSWHVIQGLPESLWEQVHSGGLGIWLPAHLAPAKNIMQGLADIGHRPFVVNMAFPDAVNVVLSKVGLGPDAGAGNVEELAVPFASALAQRLGRPLEEVSVRMVGHHWVNAAVMENRRVTDIPLLVEAEVDGQRITPELDIPEMLLSATEGFPPGHEDTWFIAASAAHKVLVFLGAAPARGHATGVQGLPGGYPVAYRDGRFELDLPEMVSIEQAVEVNLAGQRLDGIQDITEDGSVVLTDRAREVIQEVFGWDYSTYALQDAAELALEITSRYRDFAKRVVAVA
jgi:hypothetical protein